MLIFYLVSLLLFVYESHETQLYDPNKYRINETAIVHNRLVQLMRSYYEEAHARVQSLNPIRFMYEDNPYYEMGYITGEIIERYRKVLGHTQTSHRNEYMPLFEVIKRVEFVQALYFEIYHLVRMIHETPRKWSSVPEFANIEKVASLGILGGFEDSPEVAPEPILPSVVKDKVNYTSLFLAAIERKRKEMEKLKKIREEAKNKRKEHYQKQRNEMIKAKKRLDYNLTNIYNPVWPIDYGWELQNKN